MTAVDLDFDGIDPNLLLGAETLELLSDDELAEYLELIQVCAAIDGEWTLQPRQQTAESLCNELMAKGDVFELLYGGAGAGGKGLALDTPIATPNGWTTMGALRPGATVFAGDGTAAAVGWVSPVHHRACFRVSFSDGSHLIADDEHQWSVWTDADRAALHRRTDEFRSKRRASRPTTSTGARPDLAVRNATSARSVAAPPAGRVVSTVDLAALVAAGSVAIRQPAALDIDEADLPIDPYVLGAWLGDGTSANGGITCADHGILDEIELAGYTVTRWSSGRYSWGIDGLKPRLRHLDLVGNKHVPAAYLRASPKQRLALLCGLMDTDGHAKTSGSVEFTTTSPALRDGVLELIRTLGWRAAAREGCATIAGRDCGPKWRITFTPNTAVFRLARKADRQRPGGTRTRWRYVTAVEPVPSTPTRCIGVTHPDGTFLAGTQMIATHNSEWLLWHLHHLALRFPGFSGLLIRRTYKELERTAILRSQARFDRHHCRYQATNKRWVFDNGSIIEFGFTEQDRDVFQYDSAEYDVICWDELTQFPTDYPYRYLFSRLRTSLAKSVRGLTPHVVAGTNPHRTGVAWVKPRWVDLGPAETIYPIVTELEEGVSRTVSRVFVPAKMSDNRFVDKVAYLSALSLLDEATRQAIENGSWDVIEGQYFSEWNRERHVIAPFAIPSWWRRIGGLDFGIANPFAHEWVAFDDDGVAYVYREAYAAGLTPNEQVAKIKSMETPGEQIDYRVADPSVWTRTGAGPPIAFQYAQAGMPFRKANNARIDGWARLRDYLRPSRPVDDESVEGGVRLAPMIYFFSTCHDLIRTLPMLVHDPKRPEDVDTDGEDHGPDALRYAMMSRPLRSKAPAPSNPVEQLEHLRRLEAERRRRGVVDHPVLGTMEW